MPRRIHACQCGGLIGTRTVRENSVDLPVPRAARMPASGGLSACDALQLLCNALVYEIVLKVQTQSPLRRGIMLRRAIVSVPAVLPLAHVDPSAMISLLAAEDERHAVVAHPDISATRAPTQIFGPPSEETQRTTTNTDASNPAPAPR